MNALDATALARDLVSSRNRASAMIADLNGTQLLGPRLQTVNPPLWEIAHVAWFQEYWCLRFRGTDALGTSVMPAADALYDSARVAHDVRWDLPLPSIEATLAYREEVLERVLRRLEREPESSHLLYFVQLAIFHEDMHAEAFHYTRQTLAYADPFPASAGDSGAPSRRHEDVDLPGGSFHLGAARNGFVFDNEKWAHPIQVGPFRIARTAVTNAEYLEFVESGGYLRREWWSEDGWAWRSAAQLAAPRYWVQQGNRRLQRRFDETTALRTDHPVMHVNWHEAQAYCRYAGRRLPTEAEWEYAAAWSAASAMKRRYPWGEAAPCADRANLEGADLVGVDRNPQGDSDCGCRQLIGNVWEWTQSEFVPYPGFVADPYKEYSQPWFGTHKVLRGGSFSTTRRLIRNTWRNFYTPERSDIFAGFRTCALDRP